MNKDNGSVTEQLRLWGGDVAWEVLENIDQSVAILSADHHFEYVNPAYAHMIGRSVEELIGLSSFNVVHSEDRAYIQEQMEPALAGQPVVAEYRIITKDGQVRWLRDNVRAKLDPNTARPVHFYVASQDITQYKELVQALETQQQFNQKIFAANSKILYVFGLDEQKLVFQSREAASASGWTSEALRKAGKEFLSRFIHPDDWPLVVNQFNSLKTAADGDILEIEYRMRHADGSWRWFNSLHTIYKRAADGRALQVIGTAIDITDHKRVEEELQVSQTQLSGVIASAMDAIIILDESQRIVLFNTAAEEMFGCPAAGVIGKPLDRFIPERFRTAHSRHVQHFGQTGTTGYRKDLQYTLSALRADGREFPIETSISQSNIGGKKFFTAIIRDITERKLSEEALRQSEKRYRILAEAAHDSIFMVDRAFTITYLNDFAARSLDRLPQEIIGQRVAELFPEVTANEMQQSLQSVFKNGEAAYIERPLPKREGFVWIGTWLTPIKNDIGEVTSVLGISRDITDRKEAEAALRENEQWLLALIEHAPDGIVIYGTSGQIEYASPATSRILGYSQDEILRADPAQFTHPDDLPGLLLALNKLMQTSDETITARYRMRHKDGSWRWIESNISHAVNVPGISGLIFNFRDITINKQAEAALRRSETELHCIIDTVPEGVLLLASDGSIRLTNPVADQFLTILAPDRENDCLTHLGNRPLYDLFTPPPQRLQHEININDHIFEAAARPVEIGPDNTGWVLVIRDVTQERNIQQRTQQQGRLAAVGQLAAGIAHDFNNIMAVIILYSQLISRTVELSPHTLERMHTIEQQAQRATELIQQILDFSRQSVLERQPLDLLPFMKELVKLFGRTLPEHIQIELDSSEDAYIIQADPSRVQQMMMNLAVNARDAMPEGGRLQISLSHLSVGKDNSSPIPEMTPGDWIQIQVADNGSGIPPQILPKIFEPFFTTKEVGQGTGLGLAQVYGIIQQHEGYIDVTSKLGQETTFFLYFPSLDTGCGTAGDRPGPATLEQGQGQLVLLVEDDLATRQALVSSLEFMNYQVIEATNGRQALAVLETRAKDIALVLSDVVMPEMGGVALLHAMREQRLTIPVILLTGHPLSQEMENLQTLGLAGWLPKPPDLVQLNNLLAKVLSVS